MKLNVEHIMGMGRKTPVKTIFTLLGMILFPAADFYLLESFTRNPFKEVRPWAQFFNISVCLFLMVILLFFFKNVRRALRVETVALMVLGFANYYVYTFRSLPLVPWDIFSVKTAFSVADNYSFLPTGRVVLVFAGFVLVFLLEHFCTGISLKKLSWPLSLICGVLTCLLFGCFMGKLQNEDFQNRHLLYNKLFTPVFMWQVDGFLVTFIMDLPFMGVEKPSGYSSTQAEEVLSGYDTKDSKEKDVPVLPNVIVIMNEAFSDLSVLGDFTASEDYMPFIHSLEQGSENTVTGRLNVSVCGGNTANTEFEFLTGNTMAFLPQGSIPYQQYIKQEVPAVPSYLKSLGYETYALHPYGASGWDRDKVYPLMGIDNLYFQQDFMDKTYVRNYVDDASCVRKIIDLYEEKEEGKPAFIFNVTMQNHGSYGDVYNNFTPEIIVAGKGAHYPLSMYLSLLKLSDQSFAELVGYFKEQKEPTVLVFFGDHQPNDTIAQPILELNGMSYHTLTEEEMDLRYQVPYVIWANYDIEEEAGLDTSTNYLAQEVFSRAKIPLTPYQKYQKELREELPVISARRIVDKNGKNLEQEEASERLEQYKKLQYYLLFDQK